jgi:O-succinylbenzoate synthase
MHYQFAFRPYQQQFKRPLKTHHGTWAVREGIILRFIDENKRVSWGEIAPIPWFGSETLAQALDFCQQLPSKITEETIFSIPSELPACQFGFESAREWGRENWELGIGNGKLENPKSKIEFSCLLPAGEAALECWQIPWERGYRTFKWKIGVASIADEMAIFERLVQVLPKTARLRLDANGGLTRQDAEQWLKVGQGWVEFLEQPLPPEELDAMLEMSDRYSTPIALDESVATIDRLEKCYEKGWRGIFVIKAAIAGSPQRLRQFCREHQPDLVFSSVFETEIGRQAALQLAAELSSPTRAIGFGVDGWFREFNYQEHENISPTLYPSTSLRVSARMLRLSSATTWSLVFVEPLRQR